MPPSFPVDGLPTLNGFHIDKRLAVQMQKGERLIFGTCRNRFRSYCGQIFWTAAAIIVAVTFSTVVQAGSYNTASRFPASGPVVWSRIPDPENPGKFLTSYAGAGGMLVSIPAAGRGERHVTWTLSNLAPGYYRVLLKYPKHAGNASGVLVQKRNVSKDAAFVTWKTRLDQRKGDGARTLSNSFVNTSKDVTPYATSNAASFIWVDALAGAKMGTLQIRLSDSGCYSGRIVADSVVVDLMGVVK